MALFRRRKNTDDEARGSALIDGVTYPLNDWNDGVHVSTHAAHRPKIHGAEQVMGHATAHDVVSAAIEARALVTSQWWGMFRDIRTHNVIGGSDLALFENRTVTVPMLKRAEWHASTTGQAYLYRDRRRGRVRLLRPDYVDVILDSETDPGPGADGGTLPVTHALDAEVIGYLYSPPGRPPSVLLADDVAHWKPEPHPLTEWLGTAWVSSIVKRMAGDEQADIAANKFFEHGSVPSLVYVLDKSKTPEEAEKFKAINEAQTAGLLNATRNKYLGGGTDVKVVGTALKEIGLKEWRGQLETRIAMRSRVPAIILGISEGMQGSSLNAGNYGQTRRQWADGFVTPHLDGLSAALDSIVTGPTRGGVGSYLSWDPDRVQIMQEDRKDAADILVALSQAARTLTDGGFEPASVVEVVTSGDVSKLEHTGLLPVQVQQPGTGTEKDGDK